MTMITTKVDRKTYDECRAMVDERKAHWNEEGTQDADRALVKALLAQVGAWEVEAAKAQAALDDATRDVYLVTGECTYSDYGIDLCRLPRGMALADLVDYLKAARGKDWSDYDPRIEYAFRGSVVAVGRNADDADDDGEVAEFLPRVSWEWDHPTAESLSVFPSRILRKTLENLNHPTERWFDRNQPQRPFTNHGVMDDNFRRAEEAWGEEMARRAADREKHAAAVAVVERAIALAEEREAR